MWCMELRTWIVLATMVGSSSGCEDFDGKFLVNNNKERNCKQIKKKFMAHCSTKAEVREHCPLTCGLCPCVDKVGKFEYSGKKRNCKQIKNKFMAHCTKVEVQKNCPLTCGLCPCADRVGKFEYNGKRRKCEQVKNKFMAHCSTKIEVQENCPLTCGLCTNKTLSPTSKPTISPTSTPTIAPTIFPTGAPSISPTSTPTKSPTDDPTITPTFLSPPTSSSSYPTVTPTKAECTLAGRIEFPDTIETLGYHSSSLRASKSNRNAVCSSRKKRTGWGCVHDGEAKIGNWMDDYYGCNEIETVTIEYAAGGIFNFTMEHVFDDKELYYDEDHKIRPELTIAINDVDLDTFRYPRNTNTDTHIDGFVNGAYKGIVFVNAVCNELCNCTLERVMPVCPIRAEVQYPTLEDAEGNNLSGYHNDAISVFRDGEDDECSKQNPLSKWCVHEGNAQFYSSSGDDDYYDISSTESIVIPEAANGNFLFRVDTEEYYYGADSSIAGKLKLWIDNEDEGKYIHWIENVWEDTFYVDVRCDDACNCDVAQRKSPLCKIDAKVEFPPKENIDYYGYKNDFVTVQMSGEEEICQWKNVDKTSWGCLHDGGDAYVWYGQDGSFEKDTESVTIDNGVEGEYRFTLQHWPSDRELYYPNDHKLRSTISISINDEEPQKFNYPQTMNTNTHLPDGSINPDYKGTVYVDVTCDSLCHCDMIERVPTCELDAELSFPDFAQDYYGYNADIVSVTKEGEEGECGYYSPMTTWGCFGSGDAYITDYPIEDYYNYKSTQTLKIPDASNSTFYFTVEHYASEFNPLYYDSHKHKSQLNITVNGVDQGTFEHEKNTTEATNPDGTINEDYTSEIVVIVSCDVACACEAEKQNS